MSKEKSDSVIYTLLLYSGSETTRIEGNRDTTYSFITSKLKPQVDYRWEVLAANSKGTIQCAAAFAFHLQSPLKISWTGGIPDEFFLSQNYPNPFNITTQFTYGYRSMLMCGYESSIFSAVQC